MAHRTPEEDREWLLKMAVAEEEALSGSCGILACSPEIFEMMAERGVQVDVPKDIVEQVKDAD